MDPAREAVHADESSFIQLIYSNSQEAIEYGLIDHVLQSTQELPMGLIPTKPAEEENDLNMADVRGYSVPRYGDSADPDY